MYMFHARKYSATAYEGPQKLPWGPRCVVIAIKLIFGNDKKCVIQFWFCILPTYIYKKAPYGSL